ncbi:MAG TPA: hypothetical protein PLM53_12790 [Spirochaetota bacterium]|nr:hypothetical protein [Spirochaetota bacterium]HQF09414.1 hypothetical protein [Spirochaetota bacterium]HQH97972.1 hypothetical protein [Spirochaetota bacterium]
MRTIWSISAQVMPSSPRVRWRTGNDFRVPVSRSVTVVPVKR